MYTKYFLELLEGRDHMADQGVCGMIVLNPYKFSV